MEVKSKSECTDNFKKSTDGQNSQRKCNVQNAAFSRKITFYEYIVALKFQFGAQ